MNRDCEEGREGSEEGGVGVQNGSAGWWSGHRSMVPMEWRGFEMSIKYSSCYNVLILDSMLCWSMTFHPQTVLRIRFQQDRLPLCCGECLSSGVSKLYIYGKPSSPMTKNKSDISRTSDQDSSVK